MWRGGKYAGKNGSGQDIEVQVYPRPLQAQLPVWITSAGALRTIVDAGSGGFNLLTHLLGQTHEDVVQKVQQYKAYRNRNGHKPGLVSLMLHTFLAQDKATAKSLIREPFLEYLRQSADLSATPEQKKEVAAASPAQVAQMLELAFDRYVETASLVGTPQTCLPLVKRLAQAGITDLCCLVDFGLPVDQVMEGLTHLTELKKLAG
jgi:natural product biosynthesis luciferase-like monooxygenase protein